jgi:hypothetical protein
VEVMRLLIARSRLEGDSEVVPQSIDEDDDRFVEALRMPAALCDRARTEVEMPRVDGKDGAFGAVLEDEAREQEAAAEEVDAERVEDPSYSSAAYRQSIVSLHTE